MIKVYKRNQSFIIESDDSRVNIAIKEFLKSYVLVDYVYDHKTKKVKPVTKYIFSGGNRLSGEFIVNKNSFKRFIGYLKQQGISPSDIELIDTREKASKIVHKPKTDKIPRDYQIEYEEAILRDDGEHAKLVDLQPGGGKAHGNSTRLWKYNEHYDDRYIRIDEVKIGDIILGRNGQGTKILNIYPQGILPMYEVKFKHTSKKVCLEHLWTVYLDNVEITIDTEELISLVNNKKKVLIPKAKLEKGLDIPLISEVYNLGRECLGTDLDLGLLNIIIKGSLIQRTKFIRGMFDNLIKYDDGKFYMGYSSLRHKFKLISLIESLNGETRNYKLNTIEILGLNMREFLTKSKYRKKLYNYKVPKYFMYHEVLEINEVEPEEATCISVDSYDNLYTLEDNIVTHNTYITSRVITAMSEKTMFLLLPKYLKKWVKDLKSLYHVEDNEIIVLQGRDELVDYLENGKDNNEIKYILLSNRTFSNFIHEYEGTAIPELFDSPILPKDICKELNIGLVVTDEVHNELYSIFKAMLYLDPKLFLGLSGTFLARNKVIKFIQDTMFNDKSKLSLLAYNAYAVAYSISYRLKFPGRFRKADAMRGYSHIIFEQILMMDNNMLMDYFKMIKTYLDIFYIDKMKKGDRAIVFCTTIDMCTRLTNYLNKEYSDLSVKRFVKDDPDEHLYDSDIRVTTIKSGGEAVDISDLIYGLLTVSIDSIIANMQAIGRLREIKGRDVIYNYIWCEDIRTHKKYDRNKHIIYSGKVKEHHRLHYDKVIG